MVKKTSLVIADMYRFLVRLEDLKLKVWKYYDML